MVVILGFISILAFTFVSGAVGHVTLTIIDDFFRRFKYKRLKMKHLSEGWPSVLFWLTMLVISLFGLARVKLMFQRNRVKMAEDRLDEFLEEFKQFPELVDALDEHVENSLEIVKCINSRFQRNVFVFMIRE